MKVQVKIRMKEVLTYEREAIICLPDGVFPEKINELLDKAARHSVTAHDVTYYLKELGCEIVEKVGSDSNSPNEVEVEVFDYDVLSRPEGQGGTGDE